MSRHGMENKDAIITSLEKHGIPVTRENYLNLMYFGDTPAHINEDDLPEEIRKVPRGRSALRNINKDSEQMP